MKKKSFKGMTLAEVIISMAVFAMLGVILIKLGMVVDQTTKSSNRLNKRVSIQAPYAASRETVYEKLDSNGKPVINKESGKAETAELTPDMTQIDISIPGKASSKVTIHGKHYNTKSIVENNSEVYNENEVTNSGHHLQFIDVVERIDVSYTIPQNTTKQITYKDGDDEKPLEHAVWLYSEGGDEIATIDENGLITASGSEGTCIALGESDNGNYCVTITVTAV